MKTQKCLLLFGLNFLLFAPKALALSDIDGVIFEDAIRYLEEKSIVHGYPDGTYRPLELINRAEFSKIIMEAQFKEEIDASKTNCFPDVTDQWFAKYICLAKEKGIVSGYLSGEFIPANNINFAEAAKIVVNSFGLATNPLQTGEAWYEPFVQSLSAHKAIPFNLLTPDQKVDRSQMAYIIYRLLNPNPPPEGLNLISHCQWPTLATYDYLTDEKGIYYTESGQYQNYATEGFALLEGADPATLQVLGCEVLKDTDEVFSLAQKTPLDGASFKLLSSQSFEWGLLYTYGQDKSGVYYFETPESSPLPGVDLGSFVVLEKGKFNPLGPSWYGFAKDKNTGYLEGLPLPGSDGASFALIGENIAYDQNKAYVSKPNVLRIYQNLDLSPLLNLSATEFAKQGEGFFDTLALPLDHTTQLTRETGETLTVEWYKGQP